MEIAAEDLGWDERLLMAAPALVVATPDPEMTDQDLADPASACDAAMDHRIPRNPRVETLVLAQRCLVGYLAWLHDEAMPHHPFWAEAEIYRAVKRLVELQMAAEAVRPLVH